MPRRSLGSMLALVVIVALVAGACGSSGSDVQTTSPVATTLTQPTATTAAAAEATTAPTEPAATEPAPTATTEPTTTPEPAGEADVIAGKWKVQDNGYGAVYFFGEAVNQGAAPASDVTVVITLRDASGGVLASEQANLASISIIPAGELRPFKGIITGVDMSAVATQDIQIQFKTYDDSALLAGFYSIAFDVVQPQWTADHITGEITNTSDSGVQYILVSAIGYDDAGDVIAVETGSPSLDPIDAGASSPFDISLFNADPAIPATFAIFASGMTVR